MSLPEAATKTVEETTQAWRLPSLSKMQSTVKEGAAGIGKLGDKLIIGDEKKNEEHKNVRRTD